MEVNIYIYFSEDKKEKRYRKIITSSTPTKLILFSDEMKNPQNNCEYDWHLQ